jgi:hypothetical protein
VFTITPNTGNVISSVDGTCGGTRNGNTYTTKAITGPCTVVVAFAPQTYTVTASAGSGGTISPSGSLSTVPGTIRTFTVTPNSGYSIFSISSTCGGTRNGNIYTTGAITVNCIVGATFIPGYTMTVIGGTAANSSTTYYSVGIVPGTTRSFLISPPIGTTFASGGTCGQSGLMDYQTYFIYTTAPIYTNCIIDPTFKSQSYNVTITASLLSGARATPVGGMQIPPGTTQTFSVPRGETKSFIIYLGAGQIFTNGTCGRSGLVKYSTYYIYTTGAVYTNCAIAL